MYKGLCPIDPNGGTMSKILNGTYDRPAGGGLMQFIRTVGDVPVAGNNGRLAYINLAIVPAAPFGDLPANAYQIPLDDTTTLKHQNCLLFFSSNPQNADIYSPDGSVIPASTTAGGVVCGYLAQNGAMTPNLQFTSFGFQKIAIVLNKMQAMRSNGWNNDPNILGALGIGNEPNNLWGYRPYQVPLYDAWLPMRPIVHAALWKLITDQVASFCDGMFWPWPWFVMGEMAHYDPIVCSFLDDEPRPPSGEVPAPESGWPDSCYLNLVLHHYYQLYGPNPWGGRDPKTFHFHLYHWGCPPLPLYRG